MKRIPPRLLVLAGLSACTSGAAQHRSNLMSTHAFEGASSLSSSPSESFAIPRRAEVLDSYMTFREVGHGPPIVLLHGNPLSSRVWRNVVPVLADRHRCVAPDLIGMGDSGKPDLAYRFADHARYLEAFLAALDLREVILVGYDWGGVLAMDWASRHPDRVRGLVLFETFLRPLHWSEWTPRGAELFRALRTPGVGDKMVLDRNEFLARSLSNGISRKLGDEDLAAYYAPYATPSARRPLLQWPREIPVDGEPADVAALFARFDAWLASSSALPKLLLAFASPSGLQPSPTGATPMIDWAREHVAGLEIERPGTAGHHAPEDLPEEIARSIRGWLARHGQ